MAPGQGRPGAITLVFAFLLTGLPQPPARNGPRVHRVHVPCICHLSFDPRAAVRLSVKPSDGSKTLADLGSPKGTPHSLG